MAVPWPPGPHDHPCLPREPVVPPRGDAQLPSGLQLGARVQQCAQCVCGAAGSGLGAHRRGKGGCGGSWSPGPTTGVGGEMVAPSANLPALQVWVIADKVQGSQGLSRGTVCHRTGVQPREPKGQGWDYGIGVSRAGVGGGQPGPSPGLWGSLKPAPPSPSPVTQPSPSRGAGTTSPPEAMPPGPPRGHLRSRPPSLPTSGRQ